MGKIIRKFERLVIYLISLMMRSLLPIRKGRVLLWATVGKDYGCNPMYISKYLVSNEKYFDVWWMFMKGANVGRFDLSEQIVWCGSIKYLYILNTAEFLITNHRTLPRDFFWKKRKGQKYIMTWHGSMPIKKVEKDAIESIGSEYVNIAKTDSNNCDLMLSDSEFFTNLIRNSFWYEGEILQTTIPRNQKFYEKENYPAIRNKVLDFFFESHDCYIILYAPTFRPNNSVDSYITEWGELQAMIELKYGKKAIILMRLHPNLLQVVDTDTLIKDDFVKNASIYNDMQELMIASDMLITDYSSTMFEFSMMQKTCFLYIPDKETYNKEKGFYFNLSDLPFAQSGTIFELITDIKKCDNLTYQEQLNAFINTHFGLYEQCNGSAKVCEWMKQHSIR